MDRSDRVLPAVAGAIALCAGVAALTFAVRSAALWPLVLALAAMGLGLGVAGASVQATAVEAVPLRLTGSASGIYSTSRYLGSVIGSTALAVVFVTKPNAGASGRFSALFAALIVVALAAIVTNTRLSLHRVAG
jgi:sugar phosphate permease